MVNTKLYFQDFWRYRHLLKNLISKDIKLKYRRSVLGLIWSVLNPLLTMIVLAIVFSQIFHTNPVNADVSFAVYLLTGQLVYNFFSEATNSAMGSMLGAAPLIKKVYVPKYIFPLEKVSFAFVNTLFSLIALVIVMVANRATVHPTILLFWVPLIILYVFNLGVGLILASATVFFRDIMHLYGIVITALMYLTPIMYDVSILPKWVTPFIPLNPMYWFVSMFRSLVIYGEMPTLNMWIGTIASAIVALILGLFVFKKTQDKFVLYI